jgi:intracellular sulfur oxidation DsrE/DsrF family protein
MRRIWFSLLAVAFVGAVLVTSTPSEAKSAKHKILVQWAEGDSLGQWVMTKHVGNLLDDLGQENVELEVLSYGMATFAVTTTRPQTHFAADIDKLTKRGVMFRQCHHAMDLLGVKESELLPTVTPVQGAMSEIVKKHESGWQIIKP